MFIACVADDYTGASDIASFFSKAGMETLLVNGIKNISFEVPDSVQALVVALKIRSVSIKEAVSESMKAFAWLDSFRPKYLYYKICSTFDSTEKGNIGPVSDALLETYQQKWGLLCPSLPINGRTVVNGKLYVYGIPLDQSPMRNHPLNPMWDSKISELMMNQSSYPVFQISRENMDPDVIKGKIEEYGKQYKHFLLLPDYETDRDAETIVSLLCDTKVIIGGSGLAEFLARKILNNDTSNVTHGKAWDFGENTLIISGSCSEMTLKQVNRYIKRGFPNLNINPRDLIEKKVREKDIFHFLKKNIINNPLIYSSQGPEAVYQVQERYGTDIVSETLENAMAKIAKEAVRMGYKNIIVAGGETSSRITEELGYSNFSISESVAPGIPILIPLDKPYMKLILKSGNFGDEDFFYSLVRET